LRIEKRDSYNNHPSVMAYTVGEVNR